MQTNQKCFTHNAMVVTRAAMRYSLDSETLRSIILDYLRSNIPTVYQARMGKLCGPISPFVEQELSSFINESREYLRQFEHKLQAVTLSPFHLLIFYKDTDE